MACFIDGVKQPTLTSPGGPNMSNPAFMPYVEENKDSTFRPNPSLQPVEETNISVYPESFVRDNPIRGLLWGLALSALLWGSFGMLIVAIF